MSNAPPFLSVITRTQGRRPHTLMRTLLALAAQTDQDFELLIMAHLVEAAGVAALEDALPDSLRPRTRVIAVNHGTRTAPLNAGLDAASGDYVAVLDDDDLPLPNWVATFRQLAAAAPGCMLRAASRMQRVVEQIADGKKQMVPVGELEQGFPDDFDIFEHLVTNRSPPIAVAFPRARLQTLGLRFEEGLTTAEDWYFIMQCAGPLGVAASNEVTSIYSYWETGECSRTVHSGDEWHANYLALSAKLDAGPFVLPPGNFLRLRRLWEDHAAAVAENARLRNDLQQAEALRVDNDVLREALAEERRTADLLRAEAEALRQAAAAARADDAAALRESVAAILASTSWKMAAPLRPLARLAGERIEIPPRLDQAPPDTLQKLATALQQSASWKATAPLRWLRAAASPAGARNPGGNEA